MSDDITFCMSKCSKKKCFRHKSNIKVPGIPHCFAYLKNTEYCEYPDGGKYERSAKSEEV